MRKLLPSILLLLYVSQSSAQEFTLPQTEWGVPDLQAVWKHASIIPFRRPESLGEKRALQRRRSACAGAFGAAAVRCG